jgi:hypothetical protein
MAALILRRFEVRKGIVICRAGGIQRKEIQRKERLISWAGWLAQKGDGGDYDGDEQQRSENVFVGGEPGFRLDC